KSRKAQRDAEKKRKQQIYILVGIVIAAIIVVIGIVVVNQQGVMARQTAATVAEGGAYQDILMSTSAEGMPQLGEDDAPMTIHEYSSFGCPHCASFHDDQFQELLDDVRAGDVRIVFVPVTNSFSQEASKAGFCAEEQGKFWEMHDVLFNYLSQFGNAAFQVARLRDGATALGLDVNAFEACLAADATFERMNVANGMFQAVTEEYGNVTGTPTITFNGVPPEMGSGGPPMTYIDQQIAAVLAAE
ncbi:DsbA family protein, partial [Chloroflexota bacterium]